MPDNTQPYTTAKFNYYIHKVYPTFYPNGTSDTLQSNSLGNYWLVYTNTFMHKLYDPKDSTDYKERGSNG